MSKKRRMYRNLHILVDVVAVVLVWRGVWSLLDFYLFPNNPVLSNLVGLILGLAILFFDDFLLKELSGDKDK